MSTFVRRVSAYLWPHRGRILGALAQVCLISALELLKPWPIKLIIDSVLGGKPLPGGWGIGLSPGALLLAACGVLVFIYAALGAVTVLSNYTTISIGQRMVRDLRSDLYAHLHRLSMAFHSRAHAGDLLYRVTADTFALQSLTMNCLFPATTALVLLGGMAVIMFQLDWQLTLLALTVCPLLLLVIGRLNRRITVAAGEMRERESEVYGVVQRAMSAMRVIQAFTREDEEHRRFMTASERSLAASLRLYTLQTFYSGVVNLLIALGTAAVVWVGARHVLEGRLTVGGLVVFISYLASLYGPINNMFQVYGLAQSARVGVQRVLDVLDVERDLADGERAFPPEGASGEVVWEDVDFQYSPGVPVLRGVSLRAKPGQRVAIVGPTGAGKSTLLSLLPRFYDPTRGRVLVDGHDAREYRLTSLRRQIAMVLQPPLVFPVSIRENIAFGRPDAGLDEIVAAAKAARIHDTIVRLPRGYDTDVGEHGTTLSEGEKQRLTIARAILRDSPILILDEPTSALDPETEGLIMEALEELQAGRTTFIIAHRLSTVRTADLIVVIRDGQVVEQGSLPALLVRRGAFAAMYGAREPRPQEDPLAIP
ncbi:MAG TPA: ABC transporter ATP-binding protein [Methylomirabilota bacterium]|nr:ABC transporter ATP-binding protein [Methylomirabilota bacterium]